MLVHALTTYLVLENDNMLKIQQFENLYFYPLESVYLDAVPKNALMTVRKKN